MKYFKRLFILILLIIVGIVIVSRDIPSNLMGEASDSLQVYYNIKKADEINSKTILIYIDDNQLDTKKVAPYMEDTMELMLPIQSVPQAFQCDVKIKEAGNVYFTKDDISVDLSASNDYYTLVQDNNGGSRVDFIKGMTEQGGQFFVAASILSSAFNYGYAWDDGKNTALFTVGESVDLQELPSAYDMHDDNRVTAIRNQGTLGTCWAFAALSALESTLMPEEELIFAVDHLSLSNGFGISQNDGGDYNMALAYFASWKGPVLESDDPYGDNKTDESLTAVKHLKEAVVIEEKDYEKIKRMIYTYGGVQSAFYSDMETANSSSKYYNMGTQSYYYAGDQEANHDIVIIGWDDNYPKENFNNVPDNDGAFLCRNSWGDNFGNKGYFYISYEDTNIGVNNIVYTVIEDVDNYETIYQSDLLGWIGSIGYQEEYAYFSNIFTATEDEYLKATAFYATGSNTYYDVYVIQNYTDTSSYSDMEYMMSGYFEDAGYYTVDFGKEISLAKGSQFAVVVRIKTQGAIHPIAIEYNEGELITQADISDGNGYISYDGVIWEHVESTYNCNVCLKAFTDVGDK